MEFFFASEDEMHDLSRYPVFNLLNPALNIVPNGIFI